MQEEALELDFEGRADFTGEKQKEQCINKHKGRGEGRMYVKHPSNPVWQRQNRPENVKEENLGDSSMANEKLNA